MREVYEHILAPVVLIMMLVVGGYLLVRLRAFWLRHPVRAIRMALGERVGKDLFHAVSMALAGTLGVGNIIGVALGILVGGAGSVFWMVLTAFFAMAVKFAEVSLTIHTRTPSSDGWRGGAPYYMRTRGILGGVLPALFSCLCLLCAVLEGGIIQANAVAESLSRFGLPPLAVGIALAVFAGILLHKGKEAVGAFTAVCIPLATFAYLVLCFGTIIRNFGAVPQAVVRIFASAFEPLAGAGGILGFFSARCIREGLARGLLSNEAGCGTAPLAHVTAEDTTPTRQGIWGVFEVFLDTVLICSLTALTCLTGAPEGDTFLGPFAYLSAALSSLWGAFSPYLLAVILFVFAFSTTLAWSYYGISALRALTQKPLWHRLYLVILLLSLPVGACLSVSLAYLATDILLALMCIIHLPFLFWHAPTICKQLFTQKE